MLLGMEITDTHDTWVPLAKALQRVVDGLHKIEEGSPCADTAKPWNMEDSHAHQARYRLENQAGAGSRGVLPSRASSDSRRTKAALIRL